MISGHATGLNANTQKKNKKGTKKRRKTSEGRHGGYQRISLVYTLVSSELLLAAESSHEHSGLYGGGGRGGRRGRSSWPRPLPAQTLAYPPASPPPPRLLRSLLSPRVLASFFLLLLLSYSSASLSHHFLFLSLFSSNQQQQQIITLFIIYKFSLTDMEILNRDVHKSHKVTKTVQITREKQQK